MDGFEVDLGVGEGKPAERPPAGGTAYVPAGAAAPYVPSQSGAYMPADELPFPPTVQPAPSAVRRSAAPNVGVRGRRRVEPLTIHAFESVPREAVEVWKLLGRYVPPYLRSSAVGEAVRGFLERLLAPRDADRHQVRLTVRRTEGESTEESFPEGEITIGTHAQVDLQLVGAAVSRRHARLVRDERGWCLVDLGSRNGTFLRGERIQSGYAYPLQNGETFSLPGYEITLRWNEPAPLPVFEGLSVSGLDLVERERFVAGVPAHAVLALCRRDPGGERIAIEVDLALARLLIARVLGASQEAAATGVSLRPLDEIERGVLEFVFVDALDALQAVWGPKAEWCLHLERIAERREPQLETSLDERRLLVVTLGLDFDSRRDTLRVALPSALTGVLASVGERAGASIEELYLRYRDLVAGAPVTLRAIVGKAVLSRAELGQLQPGDIMVPEEMGLELKDGAIAGRVEFRPLGASARGRDAERLEREARIAGPITLFGGGVVQVEVDAIEVGPGAPLPVGVSRGGTMSAQGAEGPQQHEEQEVGEGGALLEDVGLPLVVELGRLQVTLRDLAGLRRGQVLELGRGVEEPVQLVLEGRAIGSGRLVNVEGEIGVQIIDLLR